jgi:quaternary ammonium compound-resistance protein SugE
VAWILLVVAGLLEVVWAFAMKQSQGFTRIAPSIVTGVAMLASVGLLAISMRSLPLGSAYAVWTGIGALGAFVVGVIVLGEPATAARVLAAILILPDPVRAGTDEVGGLTGVTARSWTVPLENVRGTVPDSWEPFRPVKCGLNLPPRNCQRWWEGSRAACLLSLRSCRTILVVCTARRLRPSIAEATQWTR